MEDANIKQEPTMPPIVIPPQEVRMYCPFKKVTDYQYTPAYKDTRDPLLKTAALEHFGECIGEICMAYQKGECMLIIKRTRMPVINVT